MKAENPKSWRGCVGREKTGKMSGEKVGRHILKVSHDYLWENKYYEMGGRGKG